MEKEFIEMANRCRTEIIGLRAQIERLEPRAIAWDAHLQILGLLPKPSRGYGEDLVYIIDRRIEAVQKKMAETSEIK